MFGRSWHGMPCLVRVILGVGNSFPTHGWSLAPGRGTVPPPCISVLCATAHLVKHAITHACMTPHALQNLTCHNTALSLSLLLPAESLLATCWA